MMRATREGLLISACVMGVSIGGASAQPPPDPQQQQQQPQQQDPNAPQVTPSPQVPQSDPNVTPWENVQATTPPPAFLDTTDTRIRDDRPPPSAEQVAALREMEAEVDRFATVGGSYRDTVLSIVRREYLRQRRSRDQAYARQIREEERLQAEARERAIRLFERFIERYPDDPRYTPDAMFRLGELYFERSAIAYQEEYAQNPDNAGEFPDFMPTIQLYQRLAATFPDYRHVDGVYYLIGYCLNEMARAEEARMAWLNLVCANHFRYDPAAFAPQAETPEGETPEGENPEGEHPALNLDGEQEEGAPPGPYVDPYADCTPIAPDAEFVSETWFRIGEYHFDDYGGANSLDLAISAYGRILANPEDRNYNLALYKVAWAYYRASRYAEAIQHFAMLIQWSDDHRRATGRAGSELRPEAVQYLGISFAYDDWNENQVPDPLEGMPDGIARVQDQNLLPQDREWTAEVYFELGNVYFEENKLPEAIRVWQLALERWPHHFRAPEFTNMIARAFTRNQQLEDAINWRARLSQYSEGACREDPNCWYNNPAVVEHPDVQRDAELLAENAVINTAVHYHQEAQRQRQRCVSEQDVTLCQEAERTYQLAATAYRAYLDRYPNNPQAYELRYNLADALYWSNQYEEAAREYAAVRDSNLDDRYLSESARLVVESLKRLADAAAERGEITIRTQPPAPSGQPPVVRPEPMPELVQRLAQAREMYLARVPEERDRERLRAAYDYNNALLLYAYGYWPQARDRFARIFDERCSGPNAAQEGQVAWTNLRNMAVALGDDEELRRLGQLLQDRNCTFSPSGPAIRDVNCSLAEFRDHPACTLAGDLNTLRYRDALRVWDQAERASGDDQRRLYEQAASLLVTAVNDNPNDPQAPVALERAANALERTNRFESASRLYQRIVDEVGPRYRTPREGDDREQLSAILANAYFRLAYTSNRFFEFDRAVENYRTLADSEMCRTPATDAIRSNCNQALTNAGIIMERLQRYDDAARYYERAAASSPDEATRRTSAYRVAEMAYKQRNWTNTINRMRAFIDRYQRDAAAGELVVQAYWRISEARRNARNREADIRNALNDVVSAFSRSGQAPGSMAAEYAANSRFILADNQIGEFESFQINPGSPATMQAYVNNITSEINSGAARAQTIVQGYEPVTGYNRPTWTIAAFVRQGRTYEILARAILNTRFVMPADLQRQVRRLPPEDRDQIRLEVEGTVQGVLDQRVRPVECFAVARYALAARAARAGSIDNEYTRIAVDRLQAYGEERIAECIAEAQRNDPSFQAYTAGEFTRAPRGQTLEPREGISPPGLAPRSR